MAAITFGQEGRYFFLLWIRLKTSDNKKQKQTNTSRIKDISVSAALRISTYCESVILAAV